ncbi:MAG TPA: hypothetical protein VFE23_11365 [Usitatibacter sp.]|nr:hypothetical protein [Usitatibacter sp.]
MYATTSIASAVARATLTRSAVSHTSNALDAETNGAGTATVYAANNTIVGGRGWNVTGTGTSVVTYGDNHFSATSGAFGTMTSDAPQ